MGRAFLALDATYFAIASALLGLPFKAADIRALAASEWRFPVKVALSFANDWGDLFRARDAAPIFALCSSDLSRPFPAALILARCSSVGTYPAPPPAFGQTLKPLATAFSV